MVRLLTLPVLAVCAAGLVSTPAMAQAKIGVVNFQKALMDTAELKKAVVDLQNKYKGRQDALEKVQRELSDIQAQLQSAQGRLSAEGQADLEARGQRKQREAERLSQDLQEDVNNERNSIVQRASGRMQEIVKKLMEEKGLDVVIDAANAVSFKPALEITADAVAAYDKAYPIK